jgi:acyl-CoA thioesterase-1
MAVCLGVAASPASAAGQPQRVVAFGDSLSAGYLLPQNAAFPAVLEKMLRAAGLDVVVDNAAVSGDTSTAALDRLDWAIGDDADLVIVELGANDMLRGIDPAITRQALSQIIQRVKAKGAGVLLAGMIAAPGMGRDYEAKFTGIYADLAKSFDVPLYPFFLKDVAGDAKLLLSDGMHPNPAGVEVISKSILPSVISALKARPRKP